MKVFALALMSAGAMAAVDADLMGDLPDAPAW